MARRSIADIEKIWSNVEGVKKLSDRAVGIGPFGIGLDGLLTWVPVVGTVYSVGAAFWLLAQGIQARVRPATLLRMVSYLGLDTATSVAGEVPLVGLAGDAIDFLFPGHLMAAKALQNDIETTHWVEANEREERASGAHEDHVADMRRNPNLRRIVYLHG